MMIRCREEPTAMLIQLNSVDDGKIASISPTLEDVAEDWINHSLGTLSMSFLLTLVKTHVLSSIFEITEQR